MKKKLLAALLSALAIIISSCGNTAHGENGLIKFYKKQHPSAENVTISGSLSHGDNALVWFNSDNYDPCPMSFIQNNNSYRFENTQTAANRGSDIWVCVWNHAITFYIANPECVQIDIYDAYGKKEIPVTEMPFVTEYDYSGKTSSTTDYVFLDKDGNKL